MSQCFPRALKQLTTLRMGAVYVLAKTLSMDMELESEEYEENQGKCVKIVGKCRCPASKIRGGKTAIVVVGLRSTTRHGDSSCARGAHWRPLSMMVLFAQSFGCSLPRWRKVGLPSALWREFGSNFRWLPKLSGVTTNCWVFLRCDWLLLSS